MDVIARLFDCAGQAADAVSTHSSKIGGRCEVAKDSKVRMSRLLDVVFTQQGSLASQITAGKVLDDIARLPDCAGQASDAVSADTQVKMENAPRLFKIPKSGCPYIYIYINIWIRLPRHSWPKSWSFIENLVIPTCWLLVGKTL